MTLVLGHGKFYKKKDIWRSPIDVNEWYNDKHITVDREEYFSPDIVFDLRKRPWNFAEKNSFNRIIDCTGFTLSAGPFGSYKLSTLSEIYRVLKENGIFYGRLRKYIKKNGCQHHV